MSFDAVIEPGARPRALRKVAATAAALGLAAALGVLLAFNWVEAERERALRSWQVRLGPQPALPWGPCRGPAGPHEA